MSRNAECAACWITAADMPYEEMDLSLEEASELWFTWDGGARLCNACNNAVGLERAP